MGKIRDFFNREKLLISSVGLNIFLSLINLNLWMAGISLKNNLKTTQIKTVYEVKDLDEDGLQDLILENYSGIKKPYLSTQKGEYVSFEEIKKRAITKFQQEKISSANKTYRDYSTKIERIMNYHLDPNSLEKITSESRNQ